MCVWDVFHMPQPAKSGSRNSPATFLLVFAGECITIMIEEFPIFFRGATAMSENQISKYVCRHCAKGAFLLWKGWCTRDAREWSRKTQERAFIPVLDLIRVGSSCPQCQSSDLVNTDSIYFVNFHGDGNTGLPDYFTLEILEDIDENRKQFLRKFGRPYCESPLGTIPIGDIRRHVKRLYP